MNDAECIVDWLTYRSYESNRRSNPHIPYYKWRKIYPDALVFEDIYERYIQSMGCTCYLCM